MKYLKVPNPRCCTFTSFKKVVCSALKLEGYLRRNELANEPAEECLSYLMLFDRLFSTI
jgi:hypothetical protein